MFWEKQWLESINLHLKINMKNIVLLALGFLLCYCQNSEEKYVCKPCGLDCDNLTFKESGTCPHCQMPLILESDLGKEEDLVPDEPDIQMGSGVFLISGGTGREDKTIRVFYYQPESFTTSSRILMVIPGAGRNGDSYRDAWIEESDRNGVLILSPMYAEEDYSFEEYHLGGLINSSNFLQHVTYIENTNQVELNEDSIQFQFTIDPQEWIFIDFDRIFDMVVKELNSNQTNYDVFGHSAGGQILHRMILFYPQSKAQRVLASNSGFYTLPDFDTKLPFGIDGTTITEEGLKSAFSQELVLFLGELDNENETGGTMLRSSSADIQGTHRLARGQYFYDYARSKARELNVPFNWEMVIIPGVGHDQRNMGKAASQYLYDPKIQ